MFTYKIIFVLLDFSEVKTFLLRFGQSNYSSSVTLVKAQLSKKIYVWIYENGVENFN